jgi:hypothetical protein
MGSVRVPHSPRGYGCVIRWLYEGTRPENVWVKKMGVHSVKAPLADATVFKTSHDAVTEADTISRVNRRVEGMETIVGVFSLLLAIDEMQREYASRLQGRVGEREGRT